MGKAIPDAAHHLENEFYLYGPNIPVPFKLRDFSSPLNLWPIYKFEAPPPTHPAPMRKWFYGETRRQLDLSRTNESNDNDVFGRYVNPDDPADDGQGVGRIPPLIPGEIRIIHGFYRSLRLTLGILRQTINLFPRHTKNT